MDRPPTIKRRLNVDLSGVTFVTLKSLFLFFIPSNKNNIFFFFWYSLIIISNKGNTIVPPKKTLIAGSGTVNR